MNLVDASKIFEDRYYEWVKCEAQKELSSGFSRLRRINNVEVTSFLNLLDAMSHDERTEIFHIYINRGRDNAPSLSKKEEGYFEAFRKIFLNTILKEEERRSSIAKKINTRTLRNILYDCLSSGLGNPRQAAPSEWQVSTKITDHWLCLTEVEIERNELSYEQSISTGRQLQQKYPFSNSFQFETLYNGISIQRGFGLGFNTKWDLRIASNEQSLVDSYCVSCLYFINAVPKLLHGLIIVDKPI